MNDRLVISGAALLLVLLALATMAGLHQGHYKSRKYQMLEGRVAVIERILAGEHD